MVGYSEHSKNRTLESGFSVENSDEAVPKPRRATASRLGIMDGYI